MVPKQQRCVFALVRSLADLERVRVEWTGLLSILCRRDPSADVADGLLGIWVDAQGVANMPNALKLPGLPDARIVEAMGVNGIWMLCFLETQVATPSRADLLGALLEASGYESQTTAPGCFIPVFRVDARPDDVEHETRRLERRYPDLLGGPLRPDLSPMKPAESAGRNVSPKQVG